MLFTALFLTAGACLANAAAHAQVPLSNDTAHAQGGQLTICNNDNFHPPCVGVWYQDGWCTNFPDGFHDSVSAVTAPCGYSCRLYEDYNCGGKYIMVASPGYNDLRETAYNDKLDSFWCQRTQCY